MQNYELIEKFVLMYVNSVTVDMGESGEKSIQELFKMAKEKKLVPDFELKISDSLKKWRKNYHILILYYLYSILYILSL